MRIRLSIFAISLFLIGTALAGAPYLINYQGQLSISGSSVNGNHKIIFKIYDSLTGGIPLWQGDEQSVHITNCFFNCYIGEKTALASPCQFSNINWSAQDKYLDITIDGDIMDPRERITSVPYSLYSKEANQVKWSNIINRPATFPPALPPGFIVMWAGPSGSVPSGWLLCDGSEVSRSTYSALFASISTIYGVGNNSTTFNLPDFRGRTPIGSGQGTGLTLRNLGAKLGEENHLLSVAEMPVHTHVQNAHSHTMQYAGNHNHGINAGAGGYGLIRQSLGGENNTAPGSDTGGSGSEPDINDPMAAIPWDANHIHTIDTATAVNQNAGGGGAHNNMQPSLVCNFIIKY